MTSTITIIDRDDAIARANEAAETDTDDIAELRRLIVTLSAEITEKEKQLWYLQSNLAGNIQA